MSKPNEVVERWLPIVGYEGLYEVSDLGCVRGLDRFDLNGGVLRRRRGIILAQQTMPNGYRRVHLCSDGVASSKSVHVLVLEAFVGSPPAGMEGCHWDNNRANNQLTNLRWGTHSENMLDQVRHGTHCKTRRTKCPRRHRLVAPNLLAADLDRGFRACLACNRTRNNQQSAKRKGLSFDFQVTADTHYERIMAGLAPEKRYRLRPDHSTLVVDRSARVASITV